MADDARTTYLADRSAEAPAATEPQALSDEAVLAEARQELIDAGMMTPDGQPVTAEGADGAVPAGEAAAPEASQPDPNVLQPEPLAEKTMPTSEDVKRSILRGPGKAAANLVDFGARGLDGALEYLGVDPDTFTSGTAAGDAFDAAFGKPQTTAGQIAQDVTGLVAPMQAIMRGAQYASKAGYLTRAILGSSVVETALTSDKNTSLSNIGQTQPDNHWANNWATEMLAIENDDNGFTRFVKRTTENMIINGVAEGVAKVVGTGLERLRARKLDKTAIGSTAAEQGMKPDEAIDSIIDEGVGAKNELEALEATQPTPKAELGSDTVVNVAPDGTATVAPKAAAAAPARPTKLPQELAGAKPRYGAGKNQYKPVFASDVDRAAYIAAQPTRSKADAKYVQWGMDATGMTEAEFRLHGAKVRARMKDLAKTATPGGEIQVDALWEPTRPKVGGEATPTAPKAATEAPDPNQPAPAAVETKPAGEPASAAAEPEGAPPAPVAEAVKKKVAAGKAAELDRTERLTRAFETSTSDPAVLKAQKESAIEAGHVFTPEQAARVDADITARVTAALPEIADRPFGAHLTITKTHLKGIQQAMLAGDFHGATGILGEIIGDTTNFNKIVESGDITDLLAALANEFSKDENSYRILAKRSREATFATAEAELEALAKEYGSDANFIRQALEKQLPGKDLTKTLTAYRMLEVALASRSNALAIEVTTTGAKSAKDELARSLALTAIVNDRRAGLVSDVARALNSLQKMVDVPKGVVLRAAAAKVRNEGLDAFINTVGGGDRNITRLAEMIVSSDDPATIAKLTKKASKMLSGTLGDALYAFVIHNTLSGPMSALKNVTSSAFYQGVWKSFSNLAGAAGRDAHSLLNGKDAYAFRKEWIRVQATRAAARKVLSQDSMIRRNLREAWTTGQRVTTPGGAFMEHVGQTGKVTRLGEGNMARATELARTLRDGGQFKIPFGKRVNLGAAVFGQGRLNKLADALDVSAATRRLWSPMSEDPAKEIAKRYGYAAKLIDYAGRVNSWPMHALATGDELNASIARSAALEAETFEAVRALGLSPEASETYIRDVIENIEDIPMLQAKAAEGTLSPAALKRLQIMEDVADKADDYVRQVTFTEAPGAATQVIAHARTAIPGARWMLFFVRTPGNIARAGVRESVPGRLGMAAGAMLDGRGADAAEQLGRAAFAGGVALGGWELVTSGRMTGSGPSDPEANALWRDEGNKPYVAVIPTPAGPVELNYGSYLDPVAIPLQVMADLVEASEYMDDETHASFAEEFTGRLMQLLESKSYLGSLVDTMDLISGRGSREKAMIRVSKNFVPQSRLLATLRTNGLPVPAGVGQAMFGRPSPDDEIMSLQAFIDGRSEKGLIDRGRGVKLNEKGELVDIHGGVVDNPFVVHLVSEVAEDLPPGLAEGWLEFHAKVLGVRAQHGKFVQRDQLGEKRHLPVGYGPQNATGLLAHETDPVRDELIDVGMDKNVLATFGQFMGQELTPEQQDFYQRRYRRPTKDDATAHEMFAKVIASKEYQDLGQTVGSIKGGRAKILERHHKARMTMAQAHLRKKFPELDAVFINSMKQRAQMMSKDGSDAFAAERAARAPALIQAFKEAVDGGN